MKVEEVMQKEDKGVLIFEDFEEYWHYVKSLSIKQRNILFSSLPFEQQDKIRKSVSSGGWGDLFYRDCLNQIVDQIKDRYGIDLIDVRLKVLSGKTVYMPRGVWEEAMMAILESEADDRNTKFIIGNIKAVPAKADPNRTVVILTEGSKE